MENIISRTKNNSILCTIFNLLDKNFIYLISIWWVLMIVSNSVMVDANIFFLGQTLKYIFFIIKFLIYFILMVFTILKILLGGVRVKLTLLIFLLGVITLFFSKDEKLLIFVMLIICSAGKNFDSLIKAYSRVILISLTVIIFLSIFSLIPNVISYQDRVRQYLGFMWATTPAVYLFFSLLCCTYLMKKKEFKIEVLFVFLLLFCLLYYLTLSRFIFLVSVLSVLILFFIDNININYIFNIQFFRKLLMITPFLCFFIMFILSFFYNENLYAFKVIDSLLSGRLTLGNRAFSQIGLTLFGKEVVWYGNGVHPYDQSLYNYVDCSYLKLMFNYGLVSVFLILFSYSITIKDCLTINNYKLLLVLIFIAIFSLTEPYLFDLSYNPFLLAFSCIFIKKR